MARCRCQRPHSDCVYIVYSMSVVGQFVKVFMGSVCESIHETYFTVYYSIYLGCGKVFA